MSRNVLITAASRRVGLVHAFQRALAESRDDGLVIVTDVNPLSPAVYTADRAFRVPLATEPGYVDELFAIATGEHVRLIIPTIDDELAILGRERDRFAKAGVCIAVSDPETAELCDDKFATCSALAGRGISAASSWLPHDLPACPAFPLFIKPRRGRGGVNAFSVRHQRDLDFFLDYVPDPVVQAWLSGPEFTIDVLCDFSNRPLSIVPRRRDVIRAGVIDRGCTVKDASLIAIAESCAAAIPFIGAVNIQCRVMNGRPTIFEINPRFSGGIPLTIEAGADFPRMLVDLADGIAVPPAIGEFRDGVWVTNYESSIFLDNARLDLPPYRDRHVVAAVA